MSFDPHRDGHYVWDYLHLMAANAITVEKRKEYVDRLNGLKIAFPCENCRLHLISNLEQLPVESYANTNISLFFHSWKLHDTVNKQTKKNPGQCMTYEQAYEKWFHVSAPTSNTQTVPVTVPAHQIAMPQSAPYQTPTRNYAQPSPRVNTRVAPSISQRPMHGAPTQTPPQIPTTLAIQPQAQPTVSCPSCGQSEIHIVKNNFEEFRANQRRTFTAKNN